MDGSARTRANQQGNIDIFERGHRVGMRTHADKQRKRAIFKFHHHTLEGFLCLFIGDFQQLQDHRLIFAQHFP